MHSAIEHLTEDIGIPVPGVPPHRREDPEIGVFNCGDCRLPSVMDVNSDRARPRVKEVTV